MKVNIGNDLYLKGRIGWKGLSKDEYLEISDFRIINGYSLKDGYIDWDIAGYISKERYEESPEIKLKLNDILISKDGTIGKVGIVRNLVSPTTVASGIFILRNIIEDKLDTEYLFQYLKSSNFKAFINAVKASGSTIIHLYQRDLAKLEIDVPSFSVQKSISKILFTIDSKIELNKRINAELEAMAKTLYDYWFVQFDFPDKNGKPYKTSGGKMVWNEELKREIPEGWEVKLLGSEIEIQRGISYTSKEINGDGIPMISLNSFNLDGTYKPEGIKKYSGKYTIKNITLPGDLLIAATDVTRNADIIGRAILVPDYYSEDLVFSMDIAKIISKNIPSSFLMMLFNSNHYHNYIKWYASGTIVLHLNLDGTKRYNIEMPPKELLQKYDALYQPIAQRIYKTAIENQKLTELRDWLLPMLMNGQVKVS